MRNLNIEPGIGLEPQDLNPAPEIPFSQQQVNDEVLHANWRNGNIAAVPLENLQEHIFLNEMGMTTSKSMIGTREEARTEMAKRLDARLQRSQS
jgi:hypothetical protein